MATFVCRTIISIILVSCALNVQSNHIHTDPRIVDGTPTLYSQYPFIAALKVSDIDNNGIASIGKTFCAATLIRRQYPAAFLTASHCVHNNTRKLILQMKATGQDETPIYGITGWFVLRYVLHELFNPYNLMNDIAILFIDADLSSRSDISMVTLPTANTCCNSGETLQVIGYGKTGMTGDWATTIEYTNVDYISLTQCNRQFCQWETGRSSCPWSYTNGNNLCGLGRNLTTPCYGDSGGPLIKKGTLEQVGIVSWGIYCIEYLPAVYTNTAVYSFWISNTLSKYVGNDIEWPIYPWSPTVSPTLSPLTTASPTNRPSNAPTRLPTNYPSQRPTETPTAFPSENPSRSPSSGPTEGMPERTPHPTDRNTNSPTHSPTLMPSVLPTQNSDVLTTDAPTSDAPTTNAPTTDAPTADAPTTDAPTSLSPTLYPTPRPISVAQPTFTSNPTVSPQTLTIPPSAVPTLHPTFRPTPSPTVSPAVPPTVSPSISPTTLSPTHIPSASPSAMLLVSTALPSEYPSSSPSSTPTEQERTSSPTSRDTLNPSFSPTRKPSNSPIHVIRLTKMPTGSGKLENTAFNASVLVTLGLEVFEDKSSALQGFEVAMIIAAICVFIVAASIAALKYMKYRSSKSRTSSYDTLKPIGAKQANIMEDELDDVDEGEESEALQVIALPETIMHTANAEEAKTEMS